jgi:type II secretory pathway pseudopilin PulG
MAALLVGMSIMALLMTMALPVWSQATKREREAELIWRGEQYARAVGLFQRKFANTFPPTIDVLVEQRFLRKKYKDPITGQDFQPIPAGGAAAPGQIVDPRQQAQQQAGRGAPQGARTGQPFPGQQQPAGFQAQQPNIGIQGVVSKSNESSIKEYNGRTKYNEWTFVYLAAAQRPGQGIPSFTPGGPLPPGAIQRGGTVFAPVTSGTGGSTFVPIGPADPRGGPGGGRGGRPPLPGAGPFQNPGGQPIQPGIQPPGGPFGPRPPVQPGQRPPGI